MISKDELLALTAKRFDAVSRGDIEGALAVLVDNPCFDLYPVGLRVSGRENVRRHYEHYFKHVAPAILGAEQVATYFTDDAIAFEFTMSWRAEDGAVQASRMLVVTPVQGDKFTGERVYTDERLVRWMFAGGTFEPIKA